MRGGMRGGACGRREALVAVLVVELVETRPVGWRSSSWRSSWRLSGGGYRAHRQHAAEESLLPEARKIC